MAQQDNIDEKLEVWINQPDLELTDLDNTKSIKTNFLLCQRNFLNIRKWAAGLIAYIKYLRKLIDIDTIIEEVFEKLRNEKLTLPINPNQEIGSLYTYEDPKTGKLYQIRRVDAFTVLIQFVDSSPEFTTSKIIPCVKNNEGIVVYPAIKTQGKEITVYFSDGITVAYTLYVI